MRFFPGGNTSQGFCSRFGSILPEPKRMVYLKGGPGVGKSSLMKRVAAAYEAKGLAVEYFHCLSDPDSLDGIAIPEVGFGMMDGTAPHVYDPVLPVARDELINLADFLDAPALRAHVPEIAQHSAEISKLFRRAYGFLSAAAAVRDTACIAVANSKAQVELLHDLTDRLLPLRGGYGSSRELFAEAYTPKGYQTLLETLPHATAVSLELPFGASADALLRAFADRAQSRGLHVIRLLDPLFPDRVAHVAIPAHELLLSTAPLSNAEIRKLWGMIADGTEIVIRP